MSTSQEKLFQEISMTIALLKDRQAVIQQDLVHIRKDLAQLMEAHNNQKGFIAGVLFVFSGVIALVVYATEKIWN